MQDMVLVKEYDTNEEVGEKISTIFFWCIVILSSDQVRDFYFHLSETQPVESKFVDLADYLFKNYISNESLFLHQYGQRRVQVYCKRRMRASLFTKLLIVF